MLQRETGSKSSRCYRILQRETAFGEYSLLFCGRADETGVSKASKGIATTDCNGKVLPLEAATVRCNGRERRCDREIDWKLEIGKFELAAEN